MDANVILSLIQVAFAGGLLGAALRTLTHPTREPAAATTSITHYSDNSIGSALGAMQLAVALGLGAIGIGGIVDAFHTPVAVSVLVTGLGLVTAVLASASSTTPLDELNPIADLSTITRSPRNLPRAGTTTAPPQHAEAA